MDEDPKMVEHRNAIFVWTGLMTDHLTSNAYFWDVGRKPLNLSDKHASYKRVRPQTCDILAVTQECVLLQRHATLE